MLNDSEPSSGETPAADGNGQNAQSEHFNLDAKRRITSAVASMIRRMNRFTPNRSNNANHNVYKPLARFYDGNARWNDTTHLVEKRMEGDPFESVASVMVKLKDAIDSGSEGSALNAAIEALKNHVLSPQNQAAGRLMAPFKEGEWHDCSCCLMDFLIQWY